MNFITELDKETWHDRRPTWFQPVEVVQARAEMDYRWQLQQDVADEEHDKNDPDRERIQKAIEDAAQAQEFYFEVYRAWEVRLSRHWSDDPMKWGMDERP